jgi:hypothetical protein
MVLAIVPRFKKIGYQILTHFDLFLDLFNLIFCL